MIDTRGGKEVSETKNNEELQQEETTEEVVETAETTETEEIAVDEKDQKIAELEAKLAEEDARYLRLRADYDNLARRTRLDREAAEKYRAQSLLTELLPVAGQFRPCSANRSDDRRSGIIIQRCTNGI